jgi:hypothetical protein
MTPRTAARAALTPATLRRLGVPKTLMSDFEFMGALGRDQAWQSAREPATGDAQIDQYDRRGLLNVIAYLAEAAAPLRDALELLVEHHMVMNHDQAPGEPLRDWPCSDPDIAAARRALDEVEG